MAYPKFPVSVVFHEDGEVWTLDNETELACTLEWFDSEDPQERAAVRDADGRPVLLKIEKLEVLTIELK